MKRAIICLGVGLLLLSAAFTAPAQKVKVDLDKTADLSRFKTYTWVKGIAARNPIVNQMITDAIDAQMAAKGFKKTDETADVQILYFAAMGLDLHIPEVTWSNVANPQGSMASIGPPSNIQQGTLVVNMVDRKNQTFFFRGHAKATLAHGPTGDNAKDAKQVEKVINKSVAKMFEKYPVLK